MTLKPNRRNPQGYFKDILETSRQSSEPFASVTQTTYPAKVEAIDDPLDSNRIKVRIPAVDAEIRTSDLPWCYPAMPTHFHSTPRVGEHVIIILSNPWNPGTGRYYLGPILAGDILDDQPYSESLEGLGMVKPEEENG